MVVWLIGEQVRSCYGLDGLWLTVGLALPPAPPVTWTADADPSPCVSLTSSIPAGPAPRPPAPPPKV
jgi:hypothetical protein